MIVPTSLGCHQAPGQTQAQSSNPQANGMSYQWPWEDPRMTGWEGQAILCVALGEGGKEQSGSLDLVSLKAAAHSSAGRSLGQMNVPVVHPPQK